MICSQPLHPLYYRAGAPTLGFWLQPWCSISYTPWPLISHPQSMSSVILTFTFLHKEPSTLASWGNYLSPIQPVAWFIRPTWPSYQHCRKMPKLGAQNCSSFSESVRKMYYMAFPFPSKTIKRSWNMLKKSPGLNFKYTTKFQTLWGLLKVDIFFNPLINIIWNTASFEYLGCLPLKNFFEGPPLSCPSKSQVVAGRACVWPNPRVSDPENDSQLN